MRPSVESTWVAGARLLDRLTESPDHLSLREVHLAYGGLLMGIRTTERDLGLDDWSGGECQ